MLLIFGLPSKDLSSIFVTLGADMRDVEECMSPVHSSSLCTKAVEVPAAGECGKRGEDCPTRLPSFAYTTA